MELKDVVTEARQLAGLNKSELARACGVDPSAINHIEAGRTKTLSAHLVLKLSDVLSLSHEILTTDSDSRRGDLWKKRGLVSSRPVEPGDARVAVQRGQFKLSAGVTGFEIDYDHGTSEPIFMARRWFEQNGYLPDKLLALTVSGKSMEPSLYDGDLVIINTSTFSPKDGVVFAVNYEGEMVIKRMRRESGQWLITSDNPNKIHYPDKLCAEGCFVLGEVIYKQSEVI